MTDVQTAPPATETNHRQLHANGEVVAIGRGKTAGELVEILGFSAADNTYAVRYKKSGQFTIARAESLKSAADGTLTVRDLAIAIDQANLAADLPETERLLKSLELVAPGITSMVTALYSTQPSE